MKARTPLEVSSAVTLSGNLAKGVPNELPEEDAQYWNGHIGELHAGLRTLLFRTSESELSWLDRLIKAENDAHKAFFGQTFDLLQFCSTLERYGEDRINQWAKLELEPHFFPKWVFQPDAKVRGWEIKPESWFWQQVAAGNIKRRNASGELETVKEVGFEGQTLLVDTRCKPRYDGGKQMFANDYMGGLIDGLRKEGKIARYDYGLQSSRFGVSSHEWDEQIRPALEARPEFAGVSFRLELAIEANVIPQLFTQMPRRKDGQTNTWVWYDEFFEGASNRLFGGDSYHGGLAVVGCLDVDNHWVDRAARPVGVSHIAPLTNGAICFCRT